MFLVLLLLYMRVGVLSSPFPHFFGKRQSITLWENAFFREGVEHYALKKTHFFGKRQSITLWENAFFREGAGHYALGKRIFFWKGAEHYALGKSRRSERMVLLRSIPSRERA